MSAPSHPRSLFLIAAFAFKAAIRQRVFSVIGLLSLLLVIASLVFRTFDFGTHELGFLTDFGLGVIFFFGSLLAVLLPSLRWFEELNDRTVLPVLARPVTRAHFFLGQWMGAAVTLVFFVFGLSLVLLVLIGWRAAELESFCPEFEWVTELGRISVPLMLAGLVQVWRLWLIAAFALLLGSFARGALYTITLTFLFVIIGQLMTVAESFGPSLGNGPVRWMFEVGTALFPNLGAFAIDGGDLLRVGISATTTLGLIGYSLLYLVLYLGLGTWIFRGRDL